MVPDATPDTTGVVLILQPDGKEESQDLPIIRDCLRGVGLPAVESAAASLPGVEFSALLVRGAIPVRGYLSPDGSSQLVDPRVAEIIRGFFHAGKPIAAPCMGLAVVIESLSDLLPSSLILSPEPARGAVAVYPALRLVTTNRPLIGRAPGAVSRTLTELVRELRRLVEAC
jgi:putative intracellular protease/amidase